MALTYKDAPAGLEEMDLTQNQLSVGGVQRLLPLLNKVRVGKELNAHLIIELMEEQVHSCTDWAASLDPLAHTPYGRPPPWHVNAC